MPQFLSGSDGVRRQNVLVYGAAVVGCGPSGMATSVCCTRRGVPHVVFEKSKDVAFLWQRPYDSLQLQLPKEDCALPFQIFPDSAPTYLSGKDFFEYLKKYAKDFNTKTNFNECVKSARYNEEIQAWNVVTVTTDMEVPLEKSYNFQMLVIATGENAVPKTPEIDGLDALLSEAPEIDGLDTVPPEVIHSRWYQSGKKYEGKKVLVVGCGNSGFDITLDLSKHGAKSFMVIRDPPVYGFGGTYNAYDLAVSCGIFEPSQIKNRYGVDANITVFPQVTSFKRSTSGNRITVGFVNGGSFDVDHVVLATGYSNNILEWLKDTEIFVDDNGNTIIPFDFKGKNGLYAAGFKGNGLKGLSLDAMRISEDMMEEWQGGMRERAFRDPPFL